MNQEPPSDAALIKEHLQGSSTAMVQLWLRYEGLVYGLAHGMDWELTGRLAALLGALKIAQRGGQNHHFTRDEIAQRFKENFGTRIW